MSRKWFMLALITFLITNSYAAIDAVSHHSRANCAGFNETITWWLGHSVSARVVSMHYPECLLGKDRNMHKLET